MQIPMHRLREGQYGIIQQLRLPQPLLQRMLDLGLTEGCRVECLLRSPGAGPIAFAARGAVVALRQRDAAGILVGGEP